MDIEKQMIDQRVSKIIEENADLFSNYSHDIGKQRSYAFLLLGVSAFLDIDIAEVLPFVTEGGQDGGFDAAYIAQAADGVLQVILFQAKYKQDLENDYNFSANSVEKSVNTIKNIFDPKRSMQLNERSEAIVKDIQSYIAEGFIPEVIFVMLSNGSRWTQEGQTHIDNNFSGQKQVVFEHYNHHDILKYIKKNASIDETISLTGLAVKEDFDYKEVILGKIKVDEIARIIEQYGDNLLDRNIRKYLGGNPVNNAIRQTLLSDSKRSSFFFFNNGITMICRDFKYNALQKDDWKVQITDMQIINGGQTCKTIHQTLRENPQNDYSQTTVLLRLYAVGDDEDIIKGITLATNSQNPVDFRDLKSNDAIQQNLEVSAKELGYIYKRKRDNQVKTDVIPSSVAAEAVFAVWRQKPHLAKYKRAEFFNAYYEEIFKGLNAAQMVIAVLIFRMCDTNRKKYSVDPEVQFQRRYSQYLLATMIGKEILKHFVIDLNNLTHKNFNDVKDYFIKESETLYDDAEGKLIGYLKKHFYDYDELCEVDGRSMAAVFRWFDFVEKVLS